MRRLAGLVLGLVLGLGGGAWAVEFDRSSSEYIDMGVVAEHGLTDAYSVTQLFRVDGALGANFYNVLSRQDGTNARTWNAFVTTSSAVTSQASNGGAPGGGYAIVNGGSITVGATTAFSTTFDTGADARLYQDGASVGSDVTVAAADNAGTAHTMIGASWQSGAPTASYLDGAAFAGWIIAAQITVDEVIEEHTTCLPARDPVSHWPLLECGFGNACSGTAYDETEVAHGTYTNTPTGGETPCKTIR